MLIECPTGFESAPPCPAAPRPCADDAPQSELFGQSAARPPARVVAPLGDDSAPGEWSEEEVVSLHWLLLRELHALPDPEQPLAEKIETLNWVFTEPEKDATPFSFVSCLRVVGCSPLSPTAFFGRLDAEAIRDYIRARLPGWIGASLRRYPRWMRELIAAQPRYVARRLEKNPQWINEQLRRSAARGGLFE